MIVNHILQSYVVPQGQIFSLLAATCASLVDRCELVYHGVGDAVTLCAKGGGVLSKKVEKLHWNADGGSDLDGVTFDCIAVLVVVHVVWVVTGG